MLDLAVEVVSQRTQANLALYTVCVVDGVQLPVLAREKLGSIILTDC